ncbi:ABC transporter ATP-binding protein [Clostridium thermarum]|uniref:ABC transporter ATP-binding protein n=1 Tax=Clostridium thermarum TaxID=1716543 RepID=UPI0013D2899A|nr:ABC transporter ATP-binding protein [Clostridium thermarum]
MQKIFCNYTKYSKYIRYIKPYIKYELMIFLLVSISSIVAMVNPVLLKVIIDRVLIMKEPALLKYIILLLAIFYVLSVLIQFVSGYLNTYIGQLISTKLRKDLLNHLNKVTIEEVVIGRTGDLISKITNDVSTVTGFLTSTFISAVTYVLNILASICIMVFFSIKLAMISFVVAAFQIFISYKFAKVTQVNQQEIRIKDSVHLSFLKQFLISIKNIKSYGNEKLYEKKYYQVLRDILNLNFKNFYIFFSYSNLMSLVTFLGSIMIFAVGVYEIFNGKMSVGALFVFDMISERFYQFSSALANLNVSVQGVIVALNRLESIFELKCEDYESGHRIGDHSSKNCSIRFENVFFSYSNDESNPYVLKDLTFNLIGGKAYALLGESGEGKSTIVNLLLRFYKPERGTIYLNHEDITMIDLKNYRRKISVIFQDPMMVDGTIEENIRYGNKDVSFEEIQRVSKICLLDEFIKSLPEGYDTKIGEAGEKLSGGQKQRICIARALLRNSDIYIFDEAFSNLDKKLENELFKNLETELEDRLRIYISHNIKLIKNIENIIVIKEGGIEDIGNHKKLMESSQLYKELNQKGEGELEESQCA